MRIIIKYTDNNEACEIEFDDFDAAYSFTFSFECSSVEVVGQGVYNKEEFQTAYSY